MTEPKLMSAEEIGRRVDEALNGLNLPDDIIRWTSVARMTGWQGDPLIHIVFIVRDGLAGSPRAKSFIREWTLPIEDALRAAVPDRDPFVIYRSESDQKDIEAGVPLR